MRDIQPYELDAFLGPSADEITAEQREALTDALAAIAARYPTGEDGQDDLGAERGMAATGAAGSPW